MLNNEITERELEVHIIKDVKEVINSYNKVLSKSPFLEILSETPIKLSAEDETYIISFLKTELIKFFDDSIKLSLEDVDINIDIEHLLYTPVLLSILDIYTAELMIQNKEDRFY